MKTFQTTVYYKRNRKEVNATVEWSYHPFMGLTVRVNYDGHDISGNIPSYQLEAITHECNRQASKLTVEDGMQTLFVSTLS